MSVGSSYSTAKAAIVTKLTARGGLSGVSIKYQAPEKTADVGGESGDAIWVDDAEGDYENVVICGLPLRLEEVYSLKLVIQSLRPSTTGTQQVADARVDALLFEVLTELATDPTFGVTAFNYFQITRGAFTRTTGFLPTGAGHGSRCELDLNVECRHVF